MRLTYSAMTSCLVFLFLILPIKARRRKARRFILSVLMLIVLLLLTKTADVRLEDISIVYFFYKHLQFIPVFGLFQVIFSFLEYAEHGNTLFMCKIYFPY